MRFYDYKFTITYLLTYLLAFLLAYLLTSGLLSWPFRRSI